MNFNLDIEYGCMFPEEMKQGIDLRMYYRLKKLEKVTTYFILFRPSKGLKITFKDYILQILN